MAVAARLRGDSDPFEAAGRHAVVELDAGVTAEVAGDQLRQGLADDQAYGLVVVGADQGAGGLPDPLQGVLDRLALGGADGHRVVEPLAEDLEVAPLDLIE